MENYQENGVKIFLTGGHAATTAAAVIEEIKSKGLNWKIFWLGSKRAIEGRNISSLEYQILPKMGVKFLNLITGRVQRRFTIHTIPSLFKIPVGFVQSFYYLIKYRPREVLSFGGYASYPVVIISWIFGIPVILHEQTSVAGRASIFSSFFAKKIALARASSKSYFPAGKIEIVGNPILNKYFAIGPKENIGRPPEIFIAGGSRGAQSINEIVGKILPRLLVKYKVVHLVGEIDFEKFTGIKNALPNDLSKNYQLYSTVRPDEFAGFLDKCDLIISRAGANTVSEIIAAKRPAILIPLHISYLAEQEKNADYAVEFGIARKILQKNLNGESLQEAINYVFLEYKKIIGKVKDKKSPDISAARDLVNLLSQYLK